MMRGGNNQTNNSGLRTGMSDRNLEKVDQRSSASKNKNAENSYFSGQEDNSNDLQS